MLDPLSIIGGIVAIGQATATVAKYAERFYQISSKAGVLADEVEFFASHIDSFGSIISSVHSTIRDHYNNCSNSITIRRLHEHATLKILVSQSKLLMRRVKHIQPKSKAKETGLDIWARLQWLMKKEERKDICMWMDRVKLLLLLIMHQITYEALQRRASQRRASNLSPFEHELYDFRREMKNHKRLIRTHMKSMRVLSDRQERLNYNVSTRYGEAENIAFNNIEEVVLHMGQDIVTDRLSSETSVGSPTNRSRSSDDVAFSEVLRYCHRLRLNQQRDSPQHHSGPQPSHSESSSHIATPVLSPHSPYAPPDRQQARTPESMSGSSGTAEDPGPVEASHWGEDHYTGVKSSDQIVRLDPDLNSRILQGYVNSNLEPTYAILNSEFPQNVISQAHAAELELEVEYFHDEDEMDGAGGMQIDFGDGDAQLVIGRATVVWKNGPKLTNLRPLNVTCLVCEHVPFRTPLIFGQLYLERKRHYWGE